MVSTIAKENKNQLNKKLKFLNSSISRNDEIDDETRSIKNSRDEAQIPISEKMESLVMFRS